MTTELIEAAKAVIARWDSTDWKAPATAEVMNRLRNALGELSRREAVKPINGIPATLRHDEGAIARCSYCKRYTKNLRALGDRPFVCDCGKSFGWSGSFTVPDSSAVFQSAESEPAKCVCDEDSALIGPICGRQFCPQQEVGSEEYCANTLPSGAGCCHERACHGGGA